MKTPTASEPPQQGATTDRAPVNFREQDRAARLDDLAHWVVKHLSVIVFDDEVPLDPLLVQLAERRGVPFAVRIEISQLHGF